MSEPDEPVSIALRIPGRWSHPRELIARLPVGCRFTPESLALPGEEPVEFGAVGADDQFGPIFRSSCRASPTEEELATVDRYTVNVLLRGPGGSLPAARAMMRAAAAVVRAGGAGVFIDNSALAHGGQAWCDITDDGGPDALSFAFVSIVRGRADVWTMGMHVLGFSDVVMNRVDCESGGFDIVEVILYVCRDEKPVGDGHVIADLNGPRFVARAQPSDAPAGSPHYNPFGRLRLVSAREIAESN